MIEFLTFPPIVTLCGWLGMIFVAGMLVIYLVAKGGNA
jgi:hypothetical protein